MAYTLEQRAETIAEYRLTGSVSHAARHLGAQRKTVRGWIQATQNPFSDQEKEMAERAEQIAAQKRVGLDDLYQRTVELQMRDVAEADFRDRTGLIKIVGEQRALAKGLPTSIVEHGEREKRIEAEVERLAREVAERANGNGALSS